MNSLIQKQLGGIIYNEKFKKDDNRIERILQRQKENIHLWYR